MNTPAIISPTTCGWPSRRAIIPTSRQTARIKNICRKNATESWALVIGIGSGWAINIHELHSRADSPQIYGSWECHCSCACVGKHIKDLLSPTLSSRVGEGEDQETSRFREKARFIFFALHLAYIYIN